MQVWMAVLKPHINPVGKYLRTQEDDSLLQSKKGILKGIHAKWGPGFYI